MMLSKPSWNLHSLDLQQPWHGVRCCKPTSDAWQCARRNMARWTLSYKSLCLFYTHAWITYECLFATVKYFMFDKGRGKRTGEGSDKVRLKRALQCEFSIYVVCARVCVLARFGQPLSLCCVCPSLSPHTHPLRRMFTDHSWADHRLHYQSIKVSNWMWKANFWEYSI